MARYLLPALVLATLASGRFVDAQQAVATPSSARPAGAAAAAVPAPPAPVAAAAAAADSSGKYKLVEGTDVTLRFAQALNSKTAADGDPVELTLADDLKVGEVIVARAGSHASGEVTNAKKSGMLGKAGELNLRLDYLKAGDAKVRLRGTKGKEGESGTTSAVVLTVLFGPIGLIKHGKNVDIKEGTNIHAFVAEDISLLPVAPTP